MEINRSFISYKSNKEFVKELSKVYFSVECGIHKSMLFSDAFLAPLILETHIHHLVMFTVHLNGQNKASCGI